jgi:hypothetical protein
MTITMTNISPAVGVGVLLLQGAIPPVGGRGSIHHAGLPLPPPGTNRRGGGYECCPYRRVRSPGKKATPSPVGKEP